MLITSIKPELTRDEAEKKFRRWIRVMKRGRLQTVIDFYIPYRLFEVSITSASGRKTIESLLAIDSVAGERDPYKFKSLPDDDRHVRVETESVARRALSEAQSFGALKEKISRARYLKSFFRAGKFQLKANCIDDFHIPYWIGIYMRGDEVNLEVIDGLKGTFEGPEIREIANRWLNGSSLRPATITTKVVDRKRKRRPM